jgi:hypothetical protein
MAQPLDLSCSVPLPVIRIIATNNSCLMNGKEPLAMSMQLCALNAKK